MSHVAWSKRKQKKKLKASYCVCVKLNYVPLFVTPWTVAHQAPQSMGFPRQEYWSGLPYPPPGDLPDSGIEIASLVFPVLAGRFFTTAPSGKPTVILQNTKKINLPAIVLSQVSVEVFCYV